MLGAQKYLNDVPVGPGFQSSEGLLVPSPVPLEPQQLILLPRLHNFKMVSQFCLLPVFEHFSLLKKDLLG